MIKTNVLVIGGGPAGMVAAITAKKKNQFKKVLLVREHKQSVIPCGIPYIFNRLVSVKQNIMPDKSLEINKINLIIDKVEQIDVARKLINLRNGKQIKYNRLIIATGSESIKLPIKGINKKGVWIIKKDFVYLKKMRQAVVKAKKIVIIGGGYIGVELAEELSSTKGLNISIIEKLNHCLGATLDNSFATDIEQKLKDRGIVIYTKKTVKEIGGQRTVKYVELNNGVKLPADLVIVSVGVRSNVSLVKDTNIALGEYGAIKVDSCMRTNVRGIFAVGDCAETKDFFTGKSVPVMLASIACYEARIAGTNVYGKKLIKNKGTLAAFSTFLCGSAIGAVGLTEKTKSKKRINNKIAKIKENDVVISAYECPCYHPGTLPNTQPIRVKLIFSKPKGLLLGGQIMGPESVGEVVNALALAIQQGVTAHDLSTLQIATHPLLTPAPTVYPLISAAQLALTKL